MEVLNQAEVGKWMAKQLNAGDSCTAVKGDVGDEKQINVAWVNRRTGERIEIAYYDPENLETFEGEPHFLHSDTCPSYCDYACNAKGFEQAEMIKANTKEQAHGTR